MKKNNSTRSFPEVPRKEKDNLNISSAGVTRRLLEKYKSKKDLIVIDGQIKSPEVNIAA